MKYTLGLVTILFSNFAFASGGGGAIFAYMGMQLLVFLWPFVVPLFFLKSSKKKLYLYIIYLVVIFGLIGLVKFPYTIFSQLSIWLNSKWLLTYSYGLLMGLQIISFILAVITLRKYGSRIALLLKSDQS